MKKYMACLLALGFAGMTACGETPETVIESSSAAETSYEAETTSETTVPETDNTTQTIDAVETSVTTASSEKTSASATSTPQGTAPTGNSSHSTTAVASHTESHGSTPVAVTEVSAVGQAVGTTVPKQSAKSTTKPAVSSQPGGNISPSPGATTSHTTHTTATNTTTETTTDVTETQTETVTPEPVKKFGNILVTGCVTDQPRAIEPFYNNLKVSTRYAQTLNHYKESLGNAVNVWNMIVPTSQAFYTPTDYADQYGDQRRETQNVADHLDGVTNVPVLDTLAAYAEDPIYSRTDPHWQALGAYYACEQFAAFAGVPYAPLDTYEEVNRDGYVGTFGNLELIAAYPEVFTYYKPANLDQIGCTYYNAAFSSPHQGELFREDVDISSSYSVFAGTDACILETNTNVDNSRVLVIFKDSYGDAMLPFLTQSFSKIYLCDFSNFEENALNFIEEVHATDVLFALSTASVTTDSNVNMIAEDLNLPEQ